MKVGFIGRFQPFHKGHYKVVEDHKDEFDDLKIIIGSADQEGTEDNPLSFEDRKNLIKNCLPEVEILRVTDEAKDEAGNKKWIKKIEKLDIDGIISQNDLVKRLVKEYTDLELIEQDLFNKDIYSGTETRRRIRSGEEWRYLVPKCCTSEIGDLVEKIKAAGTQYTFEPGWDPKNAYNDTYEK